MNTYLSPTYDANARDIVCLDSGLIEFTDSLSNESVSRLTAVIGGYVYAEYGSQISSLLGVRSKVSSNQIKDMIKIALAPMVSRGAIQGEMGLSVELTSRAVSMEIKLYPTNSNETIDVKWGTNWKGWI